MRQGGGHGPWLAGGTSGPAAAGLPRPLGLATTKLSKCPSVGHLGSKCPSEGHLGSQKIKQSTDDNAGPNWQTAPSALTQGCNTGYR